MPTHPDDAFRALCLKVADETDPRKIELLKQRLRLLLLTEVPSGHTDDENKAPSNETRLLPKQAVARVLPPIKARTSLTASRTDRSKEASSRQGDEDEVNSRAKQQGQVGECKHNRDWWTLQNIGEVSNSVASRKVPAASMTKIITQY